MRTLTTVLALCGSIWALGGLAGWFLTVDSLRYVESATDVFRFLVTITLLTSGYFVWWGWVFYSFKKRFPFVAESSFWVVSLVHHILCVFYLIPMDVWGGGDDPWWIPLWMIGNALIAAMVLARCLWNEKRSQVPK